VAKVSGEASDRRVRDEDPSDEEGEKMAIAPIRALATPPAKWPTTMATARMRTLKT